MMYRQKDGSLTRAKSSWSVLRYDLPTAIDVLGLPCLVKLSENDVDTIFHGVTGNSASGEYQVKFEKTFSFFTVRARVCELNDIDWFTMCKGEEFVAQHRRLVGTEFLIPMDYKGKIRLADRTENREYRSITEVIKDFPKFVRVESDTACFSPGDINYHVVHKGTVLELDRVTQNNRRARGSRENFLICFDRESGQELAFRVMSPVHFKKVHNTKKYSLREFIECIQLPQKVEFVNINPYDVVVADDSVAVKILVMLSGPVELLELTSCDYLIGRTQNTESGAMNILALPTEHERLENFLVYIPSTSIIQNAKDHANTVIPGQIDCDIFRQRLYMNSDEQKVPLLLRCDLPSTFSYDITDPPDTPPLPPKYDFAALRSTLSEQHVPGTDSEGDEMDTCRKRFLSTGDLKGARSQSSLSMDGETRGIRGYLTHLSHRIKSKASQVFSGNQSQANPVSLSTTPSQSSRSFSIRKFLSQREKSPTNSSFVCYINCSDETDQQASVEDIAHSPVQYRPLPNKHIVSIPEEPVDAANEETANLTVSNNVTETANQTVSNNVTDTANVTASNNVTETANLTASNNVTDTANLTVSNNVTETANLTASNNVTDIPSNKTFQNQNKTGAVSQYSLTMSSEEVVYATVKKVQTQEKHDVPRVFLCQICCENYQHPSEAEGCV